MGHLYILWAFLLLTLSLAALISSGFLYIKAYKNVEISKKKAETIAKNAKMQVNKFISMTPDEFNSYLIRVTAMILDIESSAVVSERDPHAQTKLYASTLVKLIEHFSDSYETIQFYYGKDFLINWFALYYQTLELNGKLESIINKALRANDITKMRG